MILKRSKHLQGKTNEDWTNRALAAVLVGTALLYGRTLQNGFTQGDDYNYILKNPFFKNISWATIPAIFSSFYACNYHPLATLVYLLWHILFGIDPIPYHALDVLLHVFDTFLVFKLAEQLGGKKITAFVVCVLFAVHPMHVESVAWASETKDVLYTMFYLSSLIVYLRYIDSGYKAGLYISAILFFLLSLLSKSAAVTLPVLLIAVDLYRGRMLTGKSLLEKLPFFLLALSFGILNIAAQRGAITDLNSAYNFINRIFLFTATLSFYLVKLPAPFGLSAIHFFPGTIHGALPWLFYASLPFLTVVAWLISRPNAYRKEILFGFSFFLITISVMLQVVPVGAAFASERYTYVPYIGLFYILGQWIADTGIHKYRNLVAVGFSLAVVFFGVLTWNRIGVWKNDQTMFADIVRKDPPHAAAYAQAIFQTASAKLKNGMAESALDDFTGVILLSPKYENAYFNRALIYAALHNYRPAIADFTSVLSLDPKAGLIYNYRGQAYYQSGNSDSAIADYSKAILLDTAKMELVELYNERGNAFFVSGKIQEAINDYDKAIALNPHLAVAYTNRGWAYSQSGNFQQAINDYEQAVRLEPKNTLAYGNLGAIKANAGDFAGSVAAYDSLLKINPKDDVAHNTLAYVLLSLKDTAGACANWKAAAGLGNADAAEAVKKFCH